VRGGLAYHANKDDAAYLRSSAGDDVSISWTLYADDMPPKTGRRQMRTLIIGL
jgi:hypothetical protein